MKYPRTMPPDDQQKSFKLAPIGENKFQITEIFAENEEEITVKCEVISDNGQGITLLHRVSNNPASQFFWLTKLFLKCIGEPCEGDVVIDTDNFIGRQFFGEVKHTTGKDGKTYANIKKLIYKDDIKQFRLPVNANPGGATDPSEIIWDEK